MTTDVMDQALLTICVLEHSLDRARAVLRAVAAGDPVDNPAAAAEAARALAALPPVRRP